jgi:L-amino acid N-acyltransferase YncA
VASQDDAIVGYGSFERGHVRWTRHVAELRVVVAGAARGLGIGRLLLESVFELALEEGVMKVVARMTPDQTGAQTLFKRLGFEEEAVLRDHAMDANGLTHDLVVLSYRAQLDRQQRCSSCGAPVLTALSLEGAQLCSHCFESQYEELGGGG